MRKRQHYLMPAKQLKNAAAKRLKEHFAVAWAQGFLL